jgi:hypothetical protein
MRQGSYGTRLHPAGRSGIDRGLVHDFESSGLQDFALQWCIPQKMPHRKSLNPVFSSLAWALLGPEIRDFFQEPQQVFNPDLGRSLV